MAAADDRFGGQKGPGRYVTPSQRKLAKALSVAGTVVDGTTLLLSGAGAAVETLSLAAGSADPLPIEGVSGLGFYYGVVNPWENFLSAVGTALTGLADYFSGHTYFDSDTKELVLGQNTIVSLAALYVGNESIIPLEGFGDSVVTSAVVVYDYAGLAGVVPTWVENRTGIDSCRGGFYVDLVVYGELAAQLGLEEGTRVQILLNLGPGGGVVPPMHVQRMTSNEH